MRSLRRGRLTSEPETRGIEKDMNASLRVAIIPPVAARPSHYVEGIYRLQSSEPHASNRTPALAAAVRQSALLLKLEL
jgi:hypothetical protein